MNQDRWEKIQAIFEVAVQMKPRRREAYLDSVCKNQPHILKEVRSLLGADAHSDRLMGQIALQALEIPESGLSIDQQVGPYRIVEQLGSGGMGVLYKALDSRLDRYVVLKFLPSHLSTSPSAKQRFMLEAKAASTLDHPTICTIFDFGEAVDGQLYIVMAFYEGQDLGQRLANGPLPLGDTLCIGIQICQGLGAAHRKGIFHRDIKPANVILTLDDQVKIVDFGIAKMTGVDITRTGDKLGSAAYMSPEQCKGETVDQRTDIWSLGVVLYEMLTSQQPFSGKLAPEIMHAVLTTQPRPLSELVPDIPGSVNQLVNRCIAKDPQERYQDTAGLLSELRKL